MLLSNVRRKTSNGLKFVEAHCVRYMVLEKGSFRLPYLFYFSPLERGGREADGVCQNKV